MQTETLFHNEKAKQHWLYVILCRNVITFFLNSVLLTDVHISAISPETTILPKTILYILVLLLCFRCEIVSHYYNTQ